MKRRPISWIIVIAFSLMTLLNAIFSILVLIDAPGLLKLVSILNAFGTVLSFHTAMDEYKKPLYIKE